MAHVGVMKLSTEGVVGARAEEDGLVAIASGDGVVRGGTLEGHRVSAVTELYLVVRARSDSDRVSSVADMDR